MHFSYRRLITICALCSSALLGGCAANCGGYDPNSLPRHCALLYATLGNEAMDQHLDERQQKADALRVEATEARKGLEKRLSQMQDVERRLARQQSSSQAARDKANKLRAELDLKKQDIERLKGELLRQEQHIAQLKSKKDSGQSQLAALDRAQEELRQSKQQVDALQDYIDNDLLIRAENALRYD